jgi:hypothetical protein
MQSRAPRHEDSWSDTAQGPLSPRTSGGSRGGPALSKHKKAAISKAHRIRRFSMSLIPAHVEATRQHRRHWVQAWVDYESCLQAAFQALTPFTVILLNDLVAEARADEVWAPCPLCWSLKHAYQHGPTSSECPYWVPIAAERGYQRGVGSLLGKAGSEPAGTTRGHVLRAGPSPPGGHRG